jgi:acyl-CoA hydrolase
MTEQAAAAVVDVRAGNEVHLDEWVAPEVADEHGYLRGGKILEWMDAVGALAAMRHCRVPVVTASVDGLELKDPIAIGERVTMTASVACTSARTVGIGVSMRHGRGQALKDSVDGYMTFVSLDEHGVARPVPQLAPQTPDEVARFREGMLRRDFRTKLASGQLPSLGDVSAAVDAQARPIFIRELLKILPKGFRVPWERAEANRPRSRHGSYVHKIEMVRASKLNFHGTLYGGTLMRWIETTASLSARAYLDGAGVRLGGLHGLTFIRPTTQNVFVHIRAAVVHTNAGSLTTLVTVQSEDPLGSQFFDTLRAFLTFVPYAPGKIAPLDCPTSDDIALFEEVEHRLALQRTLGVDRTR